MQEPDARTGFLEVSKRTSPAIPETACHPKTPGLDSDSVTNSKPSRTPKERSTKVIGRKTLQGLASEKKRPGKVSELESQIAQVKEEFEKTKDQLSSSESWKSRAQQEAEEAKIQLAAMTSKLEESQKQLLELSDSEEARIQELLKISHDRDRAWQSELDAVYKQHSMDSAALASAKNEIEKLKMQLEKVAESAGSRARHAESVHVEIQDLKLELTKNFALIEKLKAQLNDSKESEAGALEKVGRTLMQLEMATVTEEKLRLEGLKAMEACKSLVLELEQSNARANSLEELVSKLQHDLSNTNSKSPLETFEKAEVAHENGDNEEVLKLKTELNHVKLEVGQLRSALEAAERKYQEEYIQSTLQIRCAYELVEHTKLKSCQREAELEAKLKITKADIEELKGKLEDKEAILQSISEENKGMDLKVGEHHTERETHLEMELKKLEVALADLGASLLDKETELQKIMQENEMLNLEMKKRDIERGKVNDEALPLADAARDSDRESLTKFSNLTGQADKSSRRAARVTEQLDAAWAANSEMEAELRKLKVQSDQWRKAAEAAASMLSTGNNEKNVERTVSLDFHTIGGKLASPLSEDIDDDSPKKKNGNMLKKIGVLLKGHK